MREFITYSLKVVAFLLILAIADLSIGYGLKAIFSLQKSGKYFTTAYAINDCREDIVILGNSHAAHHFDAPLMVSKLQKSVFNLGNQGQSLFYVYTLVRSLSENYKPKLIIIDLDHNSLVYDKTDYQKLTIFLPFYRSNPYVDSAIEKIDRFETFKAQSNLYRFNSTLGYICLNTFDNSRNKSLRSLGFDPISGDICGPNSDTLTASNKDANATENDSIDMAKVDCLNSMISYLSVNKIPLLVTTTPSFNTASMNAGKVESKLQSILHNRSIEYLDDSNNPAFNYDCRLFHDKSHLNPAGARKWTERLVKYLESNHLI